jgi:hypothetical protein
MFAHFDLAANVEPFIQTQAIRKQLGGRLMLGPCARQRAEDSGGAHQVVDSATKGQ